MLSEFLRNGIEKFLAARWRDRAIKCKCQTVQLADSPDSRGQRARELLHFGGAQWQSMIGRRACDAGRRLNDIQAIHLAAKAIDYRELIQIAAARKFSRIGNVSRSAAPKIRIERKDNVSFL